MERCPALVRRGRRLNGTVTANPTLARRLNFNVDRPVIAVRTEEDDVPWYLAVTVTEANAAGPPELTVDAEWARRLGWEAGETVWVSASRTRLPAAEKVWAEPMGSADWEIIVSSNVVFLHLGLHSFDFSVAGIQRGAAGIPFAQPTSSCATWFARDFLRRSSSCLRRHP